MNTALSFMVELSLYFFITIIINLVCFIIWLQYGCLSKDLGRQ